MTDIVVSNVNYRDIILQILIMAVIVMFIFVNFRMYHIFRLFYYEANMYLDGIE